MMSDMIISVVSMGGQIVRNVIVVRVGLGIQKHLILDGKVLQL